MVAFCHKLGKKPVVTVRVPGEGAGQPTEPSVGESLSWALRAQMHSEECWRLWSPAGPVPL